MLRRCAGGERRRGKERDIPMFKRPPSSAAGLFLFPTQHKNRMDYAPRWPILSSRSWIHLYSVHHAIPSLEVPFRHYHHPGDSVRRDSVPGCSRRFTVTTTAGKYTFDNRGARAARSTSTSVDSSAATCVQTEIIQTGYIGSLRFTHPHHPDLQRCQETQRVGAKRGAQQQGERTFSNRGARAAHLREWCALVASIRCVPPRARTPSSTRSIPGALAFEAYDIAFRTLSGASSRVARLDPELEGCVPVLCASGRQRVGPLVSHRPEIHIGWRNILFIAHAKPPQLRTAVPVRPMQRCSSTIEKRSRQRRDHSHRPPGCLVKSDPGPITMLVIWRGCKMHMAASRGGVFEAGGEEARAFESSRVQMHIDSRMASEIIAFTARLVCLYSSRRLPPCDAGPHLAITAREERKKTSRDESAACITVPPVEFLSRPRLACVLVTRALFPASIPPPACPHLPRTDM
ncbi:hypothetical protein B0H13DRAFT_2340680 [Mycena leptocephala]|nr:hypothetical protein B0H13DRAFT_2340680 [Mycena leptocephala]